MAGIRFVHKSASVKMRLVRPDTGVLTNLEAHSPGQGDGSEVMRQVCSYADDLHLILKLTARVYKVHYEYTMTNAELICFYRKFGFVWQKDLGLPAQMIRQPSQKKHAL